MNFLPVLLKKILSSTLCVTLLVTSLPARVSAATSVPACTNAIGAYSGTEPGCAAVKLASGQLVPFTNLQWERLNDMPVAVGPDGDRKVEGSNEAVNLANRSALALSNSLGMEFSAKDIASAVTMFPANVPFIYARYNPLDATLRVDVFKLERTLENGQARSGLYHAAFAPSHGNFWRASRSYIHPDAYRSANAPGVNPFAAFSGADSELFYGISVSGAQVAVGHAMRYLGAPVAVLQLAESRISTRTVKKGNAFRKKVTTYIEGHAKPQWLIAHPGTMVSRVSAMPTAQFCAPDPNRVECALYETASSGVSFEQFDGGMLSSFEDTWELDRKTKSGLGFLSILIIAVVGSFALAALAPALGLGAAAGAGAGAAGPAAGMFGNMLITNGFITGFSSLATSIAVEAAYLAASMAILGGANLGSMMKLSPLALLGVAQVTKGTVDIGSQDEYTRKLSNIVAHRTASDPAIPNREQAPQLTGFRVTTEGDCPPSVPLASCVNNGVVPRADQYSEQMMVNFVRDNSGQLVRDGTK